MYFGKKSVLSLLRLSECVLRLLFFLLLLFAFDTPVIACMTLLCALWHEGGHLLVLSRLGVTRRFSPRLNGLVCTPERPLSYREEAAVAAAGPAANLLFALLSLLLLPLGHAFFLTLAFCHLMTALSNLLPLEGYDGARILSALLSLHGRDPYGLLSVTSFALSVLLLFLALYLVGKCGEGYWLLGVFLFSLLYRLRRGLLKNFLRFREENGDFTRI